MHLTRQLHICGLAGIVFAGFSLDNMSATPDTVAQAEHAKVVVVANDVTVDGKSRPDIAQALADSFAAGLLRTGDYRVFQAEVPVAKGKGKKGDLALGSPSSGVMAKAPADVDLKFAFTLVGEENDYRFTLKKIRASDNEVIEVHELETHGKLDKVFGLVPNVLMKMQAKVKQKPVFPRTQSPAQLSGIPAPAAQPAAVANIPYISAQSKTAFTISGGTASASYYYTCGGN